MDQKEVMGRLCRDTVTHAKGVCIGTVDWMFGCRYYILKKRATKDKHPSYSKEQEFHVAEGCLEVIDSEPVIKADFPEEEKPKFFGKMCRDKVTGYEGICIGRLWPYYAEKQYCLQGRYDKKKMKTDMPMWVDEGRIEVLRSDRELSTEDVRTTRGGGVTDLCLPEFH